VLAAAGLIALTVPRAQSGTVFRASSHHQSGVYQVEVDALVSAPEPRVRALLTDYNHLGRVNPAIEVSEILFTRAPGDYRVRTVTEACVWFYCKRIHQVQDVIEAADGSVTATVIPEQSDFRYGYARLHLWQQAGGTRVLIRSEVEPAFWIPPIIGPWLIQRKLRSEALESVQNLERVANPVPLPHNSPPQNQ
jgi:hypothetical protein